MMLTLDLEKSLTPAGPVIVRATDSGDDMSATIYDHGKPYDMTGATVTFEVIHKGGTETVACEVLANGTVQWAMPTISKAGRAISAYIKVEKADTVATTQEIELLVLPR